MIGGEKKQLQLIDSFKTENWQFKYKSGSIDKFNGFLRFKLLTKFKKSIFVKTYKLFLNFNKILWNLNIDRQKVCWF
jgi:hypothetical protein